MSHPVILVGDVINGFVAVLLCLALMCIDLHMHRSHSFDSRLRCWCLLADMQCLDMSSVGRAISRSASSPTTVSFSVLNRFSSHDVCHALHSCTYREMAFRTWTLTHMSLHCSVSKGGMSCRLFYEQAFQLCLYMVKMEEEDAGRTLYMTGSVCLGLKENAHRLG